MLMDSRQNGCRSTKRRQQRLGTLPLQPPDIPLPVRMMHEPFHVALCPSPLLLLHDALVLCLLLGDFARLHVVHGFLPVLLVQLFQRGLAPFAQPLNDTCALQASHVLGEGLGMLVRNAKNAERVVDHVVLLSLVELPVIAVRIVLREISNVDSRVFLLATGGARRGRRRRHRPGGC